jgi:hypothetical protein
MNKSFLKIIGVSSIAVLTVVLFQNCGGDLQSQKTSESKVTGAGSTNDFDPTDFFLGGTGSSGGDPIIDDFTFPPTTGTGDLPYFPVPNPGTNPGTNTSLDQKIKLLFKEHVYPSGPQVPANSQIAFWAHMNSNKKLSSSDLEAGIMIEGFCVKNLHRRCKPIERKGLLEEYINKGSTLAEIKNRIANTLESKIVRLYNELDNRDPDGAGKAYWLKSNGTDDAKLKNITYLLERPYLLFGTTEDIKNSLNPSNQTASIVKDLFNQLVGVAPANHQVAFWQYQTAHNNLTLNQLPEAIKIEGFYIKYLKRRGDLDGLKYWVAEYKSNKLTIAQIEDLFKNSVEALIVNAYQTYDNREPDYEGRDYWRKLINKDRSHVKDLVYLLKNPENTF